MAFLIDMSLALILGLAIGIGIVALVAQTPSYQTAIATMDEIELRSGLYEENDEGTTSPITELYAVSEEDADPDYEGVDSLFATALEHFFADSYFFPDGDGWTAWPKVQELSAVTVRASQGVTVLVDGRPLEKNELTGTAPVPGFEALGEAAPMECTWQVDGLLEQPEVTAQSEKGSCRVEWETPLQVVVTTEPGEGDAASLEEFLDRTARVYARYVSDDASFAELKDSLVPDTEFYNSLRTFDSSWYVSHDSTAFEEFSVSELESFGPDAAAGTVRFTYMVYKEGLRPRSYPSVYRMYAVREGDGWKLLDLQVQ